MEIPALLKNKWTLFGILAGGAILYLMRSGSSQGGSVAPAVMGYDKELIAMGQQTALERDKMTATLQMAQLSSDTELAGKKSDNETALGLVNLTTSADLQALQLNNQSQRDLLNDSAYRQTVQTDLESNWLYKISELTGNQKYNQTALETDRNLQLQNIVGNQNIQMTQINTNAQLEQARIAGNASVASAKAGKSKSMGCCGFSLSL